MKTNRLQVLGITSVALLSASVVWAVDKPQTLDLTRLQQQMQATNEMYAANHRENNPGNDTAQNPAMRHDQPQDREQAQQRLDKRMNSQTDDENFSGRSASMRFGVGYESRMGGSQFPGFGDSDGFPATGGASRSSGGSPGGQGGGGRR
jgi:hypothetical protein